VDLGYSKIFDGKYVAFGRVVKGIETIQVHNLFASPLTDLKKKTAFILCPAKIMPIKVRSKPVAKSGQHSSWQDMHMKKET
jgi:hypothetical protein